LALVSPPPRFCEEHLQLWDDAGFGRAEAAKQSHKSVLVPEEHLRFLAAQRRA
jgi:hypothetical protein